MKVWLIILLTIAFTGCATATHYQPAKAGGQGYRDQKLNENKYRISFQGNHLTNRETVENYLFYRAAELTLQEGFEAFTMTSLSTDRKTELTQAAPLMYGHYGRANPFPYYLYGGSFTTPGLTSTNTQYEAVAYVTMLNTTTDPQSQSYKAQEVQKNLEPKIQRKKD